MQHTIADSLAKIRSIESNEILNEAAVAAPAAVASKGIGRFIPGVGAALGAYDAYGRAKQGDWAGAGLSAAGGLASLIPGVGTAASLGIAGAQALRDKQRTGSYMPGDAEIAAGVAKDAAAQPTATAAAPAAPMPAGADPKVLALQKQLIAKGAKITADGKMGPATQTAMKQFPGVAVAEQNKGNDMSESQRIAELRDRLAQLESQPQIADEGIADLAKGAWAGIKGAGGAIANKAKEIGSAFKAGVADPAGAKALAPAATKAGEKAALSTGAAVARNPGKVAAAGTAAGAAAGAAGMAAMGGAAATKPATGASAKPATGAATKPATGTPAASSLTTDEEGEMGVLAQELGSQMGRLPELDALLLQYEKLRPGAINAAP
jgi:peptidoglycan hydrolase-like protein with peptidoglycan-binding domain